MHGPLKVKKKKNPEAYVLCKLAYTWNVRIRGEHALIFGGVRTRVKHGILDNGYFEKGAENNRQTYTWI
jgi:hypothetical protein